MKTNRPAPPQAMQQPSATPIFEAAAVWLIAGCVVIAPVLLGCSGIWTRLLLESVLATATLAWVFSGQRSKWLMLMPTAILALALLQTVPLPDGLLVRIAPVSAGAWKVAGGGPSTTWNSISVDPGASAAAARRLFLGLCALAVVIDVGRRQSHRKRLLWALAVSGGVMITAGACFGSAKDNRMLGFVNLAGPLKPDTNPTIMPVQTNGVGKRTPVAIGNLSYEVDEGYVGDGFGTYIYSNHFGGGVNLTVPVLLAAGLLVTRNRVPDWARWAALVAALGAAVWLVGGVAQSRAGGGSLVLAGLALLAIAAETRALRWPAIGLLAVYAAVLIAVAGVMLFLLFGPSQGLLDLLPAPWKGTVVRTLADARILAAQVALRMAAASPLLGTGLETYETVFPRFHTGTFTMFFAHNDYAQFLAEAGLAGAAIAAAAAGVLARRGARFCAQAKGDYRTLNAGAWAALAGIGMHSALDWNLHLPANAFLACTVAGLCASSVPTTTWQISQRALAWAPAGLLRGILAVVCLGAIGFLGRDAMSEHVQRTLQDAIVLDRLDPSKPAHASAEAALTTAISQAERMAQWDSRNARLLLVLGQANLHLSRYAPSGSTQNNRLGNAEIWFLKARQASAAARGLPTTADTQPR
jgi:O-antigen ligase